jgi:hypothetical protein
VGRVGRFRPGLDRTLDVHNRPVCERVAAHDTPRGCLAQLELHPEVREAEQVVRRETEGDVVPGVREGGGDRVEPVGDAPHRPPRVVVEPVVEGVDGLDVGEDRRREEVRVAQDDVWAELARFVDRTCVHERGECRAQRVARKPDIDLSPCWEVLGEACCGMLDCIPDCVYQKNMLVGYS